jgi:Subtilase family
MKKKNFILGNGEKLVFKAPKKKVNFGPTSYIYSYEEAANRLYDQLTILSEYVSNLPEKATPQNKVIFSLYIHPKYIAKSYFPQALLKYISAKTVGSRAYTINPEKQYNNQTLSYTKAYYILTTKENIELLRDTIFSLEQNNLKESIQVIESITPFYEEEKVKISNYKDNEDYEIVVHSTSEAEDSYILRGLNAYSKEINNKVVNKFSDTVDGLTFIQSPLNNQLINELSKYTFVRSIRKASQLRDVTLKSIPTNSIDNKFTLNSKFLDNSINVAIFDGGYENNTLLNDLVEYDNLSTDEDDNFISHGVGVTSACLFGHIDSNILTPYSKIMNYKVIDNNSSAYEILHRIDRTLRYEDIEFINLSIGPSESINDDDVHYWTAILDKHFSTGKYFACIAAGNSGGRVQVPSDCVNAMTIGSSNSNDFFWRKTDYSCIGPGRSPGYIKPDGIAFGGDSKTKELFNVLKNHNSLNGVQGTSFSSPSVLRSAIGIKSCYSKDLIPISLKAILIHHTIKNENENQQNIGWGKFNLDIDDMMTCHDHEVKVIFQGKINVKESYRAPIPYLNDLTGKISIKSTFCFTTSTDAEHPPSYTNHGLAATFVPNPEKKNKDKDGNKGSSATDSFFTSSKMYSEDQQMANAHKWETVLHSETSKLAKSLKDPYFEIKYNERENGADSNERIELDYALIVTIESKDRLDIYNPLLIKYQNVLSPIKPKVQVKI